jgi:hypothetical protein
VIGAVEPALLVRRAAPSDAPALAVLAGKLGYPTDSGAIARRFAALPPDDHVWVAVREGHVIGLVHWAYLTQTRRGSRAQRPART